MRGFDNNSESPGFDNNLEIWGRTDKLIKQCVKADAGTDRGMSNSVVERSPALKLCVHRQGEEGAVKPHLS